MTCLDWSTSLIPYKKRQLQRADIQIHMLSIIILGKIKWLMT